MRYSDYFKVGAKEFEVRGIYNGWIGQDAPMHIDPLLLKGCVIPEFRDAYNSFFDYFKQFVPLARHASRKNAFDIFYRQMIRLFVFKEPANTGLGYSKGKSQGSGISGSLSRQLASSAFDIIKAGFEDPEIFGLLPLIEDGIGADRISDMTIRILMPNFMAFTARIAKELGIQTSPWRLRGGIYEVPEFNRKPLLFIPKEFLIDLPMPQCKEDVRGACEYNDDLKRRICSIIGLKWEECRDYRKSDWREVILSNRDNFSAVVNFYRDVKGVAYNFDDDRKNYYTDVKVKNIAESNPLQSGAKDGCSVMEVALRICEKFKELVEHNHMWKLLYRNGVPREKDWQDIMFLTAAAYVEGGKFDAHVSREEDTGAGLTDFVFSRGAREKVVVEIKRSSNKDLRHGFREQLPAYMKAIGARDGIFVVIVEDNSLEKIKSQLDPVIDDMREKGEYISEIIFIDGRHRPSASVRRNLIT